MAAKDSDLNLPVERTSHSSSPQEGSTTVSALLTTDWSNPAFAEFIRGSSRDEAEKHVAEYNRKREHEFPHLLKNMDSYAGSLAGDQADDGFEGSAEMSGGSPTGEGVLDPELSGEHWTQPVSSSSGPSSPVPEWKDVHVDHGPFEGVPPRGIQPGSDKPKDDILAFSPKGAPGGDDPGDDDPGGGDGEWNEEESEERDEKDKSVKELLLLKAINSKYLPAFANEENVILHDTVLEAELALRKAEKGTRKPWKNKMTEQPS